MLPRDFGRGKDAEELCVEHPEHAVGIERTLTNLVHASSATVRQHLGDVMSREIGGVDAQSGAAENRRHDVNPGAGPIGVPDRCYFAVIDAPSDRNPPTRSS